MPYRRTLVPRPLTSPRLSFVPAMAGSELVRLDGVLAPAHNESMHPGALHCNDMIMALEAPSTSGVGCLFYEHEYKHPAFVFGPESDARLDSVPVKVSWCPPHQRRTRTFRPTASTFH